MASVSSGENFVNVSAHSQINSRFNSFDEYSKDILMNFYNTLNKAVAAMANPEDGTLVLPDGKTLDLKTTAGLSTFSLWVQSQQPMIDFANNTLNYVKQVEQKQWTNLSS